jgi:cytochrome b561
MHFGDLMELKRLTLEYTTAHQFSAPPAEGPRHEMQDCGYNHPFTEMSLPTPRIEPPIPMNAKSPQPSSSIAQTALRYTRTAIVLHWLIAALIIVNIYLGLSANYWLPDEQIRSAIDLHKSIGITVLGLVLLRILWRISHQPPPLPRSFPDWEHTAAHVAHFILYLLMIGLPLSGWAHDSAWKDAATHPMQLFGLFHWPRIGWLMNIDPSVKESLHLHDRLGSLHTWLGYALYAMLVMHIAGALKHEWIDRKSVLKRMLP